MYILSRRDERGRQQTPARGTRHAQFASLEEAREVAASMAQTYGCKIVIFEAVEVAELSRPPVTFTKFADTQDGSSHDGRKLYNSRIDDRNGR